MAKIMLVEDDNNLREIYEARLAAEGYEIVSAADGEAALALGIKEKPDLIIADIMMPKVSGFDMLDIMRSTTETKSAKIIMMTALNQAEDKAKAEKLGADLYLVKSQVTLEDVVRSAKKLLGEETPLNIGGVQLEQPAQTPQNNPAGASPITTTTPTVPAPGTPSPQAQPEPTPTTTQQPVQVPVEQAQPTVTPTPQEQTTQPATPAQTTTTNSTPPSPQQQPSSMAAPPKDLPDTNAQATASGDDLPAGDRVLQKSADTSNGQSPINQNAELSGRKKVIKPISDVLTKGPDMEALLAKEGGAKPGTAPTVNSIVTPDGITSTPNTQAGGSNPTNTMSDIIAPNPQAVPQIDPQNPPAPPVA